MSLTLALLLAAPAAIDWALPCDRPPELEKLAGRATGSAKVSGTKSDKGWDVTVEFSTGVRKFTAGSCEQAARGAALVLQLQLLPPDEQPPPEPVPPPAEPPAPPVTPPPPPPLLLPVPRPAERAPEPVRPRLEVTAWLNSAVMVGESFGPTPRLAVSLQLGPTPSLFSGLLRVGTGLPRLVITAGVDQGATLYPLVHFALAPCLLPALGERVRLGGCVEGGVEVVRIEGVGVDVVRSGFAPQVTVAPLARLEVLIVGGFTASVGGGPIFAVVRPSVVLNSASVIETPVVLGRFEASVGWRW